MRVPGFAVLGCLILVLGCGGGGSDSGPDPVSVTCVAEPTWHACATNDGVLSRAFVQVGDDIWAGEPISYRALYGFSLSEVPTGIQIQSARLVVQTVGSVGTPFGELGNLWAQHVDFGLILEAADFEAPVLTPALDHVAGPPSDDLLRFDVTRAVQATLDRGLENCDFRLEYSLSHGDDGEPDLLRLASAHEGIRASVVVQYLP